MSVSHLVNQIAETFGVAEIDLCDQASGEIQGLVDTWVQHFDAEQDVPHRGPVWTGAGLDS